MNLKEWRLRHLLFCLFVFLVSCETKRDAQYSDSELIARVGDRVITQSEFIRRAEYTPRPIYCRDDNIIHKKIVLNSLIGEKLMAIDMEAQSDFEDPEKLKQFLLGRQEQAMRQLHRYENGLQQVESSEAMLLQGFQNARRKYEISYYSVSDSTVAHMIKGLIENGDSFDSTYVSLGGQNLPRTKHVSWFDDDESDIREALYANPVSRDTVLPPVKLREGGYLFLKVLGWEDTYSLSATANQTLWNDVVSKTESRLGRKYYREYVSNLMKNKKMLLERETFKKLVDDLAQTYMLKESEKENILNQAIWDIEKRHYSIDDFDNQELKGTETLFTFDGNVWTVNQLFELVGRHPLVFRDTRFEMKDFGKQVKFAIADLLRDEMITREAYEDKYDTRIPVITHVQLWKDHYLADVYKRTLMRSVSQEDLNSMGSFEFIEKMMNPLLDRLQVQYSDQIFINTDLFEKTHLSGIDMFATQGGVAYPIMVPSFPKIYTDHTLDYGSELEAP